MPSVPKPVMTIASKREKEEQRPWPRNGATAETGEHGGS